MSEIEDVTIEDILYHISNSCEGYQDDNLYFGRPWNVDGQLYIMVSDDERQKDRVWELSIREFKK